MGKRAGGAHLWNIGAGISHDAKWLAPASLLVGSRAQGMIAALVLVAGLRPGESQQWVTPKERRRPAGFRFVTCHFPPIWLGPMQAWWPGPRGDGGSRGPRILS